MHEVQQKLYCIIEKIVHLPIMGLNPKKMLNTQMVNCPHGAAWWLLFLTLAVTTFTTNNNHRYQPGTASHTGNSPSECSPLFGSKSQ